MNFTIIWILSVIRGFTAPEEYSTSFWENGLKGFKKHSCLHKLPFRKWCDSRFIQRGSCNFPAQKSNDFTISRKGFCNHSVSDDEKCCQPLHGASFAGLLRTLWRLEYAQMQREWKARKLKKKKINSSDYDFSTPRCINNLRLIFFKYARFSMQTWKLQCKVGMMKRTNKVNLKCMYLNFSTGIQPPLFRLFSFHVVKKLLKFLEMQCRGRWENCISENLRENAPIFLIIRSPPSLSASQVQAQSKLLPPSWATQKTN